MDIKTLINEPYSLIISMHVNNFIGQYGEEEIFTLDYVASQSLEYIQELNEVVDISRELNASHAAVRLMCNIKQSYPDVNISRIIKELYLKAG